MLRKSMRLIYNTSYFQLCFMWLTFKQIYFQKFKSIYESVYYQAMKGH